MSEIDRRADLRRLLKAYAPADASEAEHRRRMLALVDGADDPFSRSSFEPGHFTASAFVRSADGEALLLIHHAKLRKWLQPGGHVDLADADLIATARRETLEETGVGDLEGADSASIFDVDVHPIPARPHEPAHEHFDVRFLFRAGEGATRPGSDALAATWESLDEISKREDLDESIARALRKLSRA